MEIMEILELFNELPPIGKLMLGLGFLMPFAVLHTYLNPEPGKKEKPKTTWTLKDGSKANLYILEHDGEKYWMTTRE